MRKLLLAAALAVAFSAQAAPILQPLMEVRFEERSDPWGLVIPEDPAWFGHSSGAPETATRASSITCIASGRDSLSRSRPMGCARPGRRSPAAMSRGGRSSSAAISSMLGASCPEPSTMGLLLIGFLGWRVAHWGRR